MLRLCEHRGIDFYTHERGGEITRYMLRKNSTPHSIAFAKVEIERLWSEGDNKKYNIGESFFIDRRNKVVQSWSVFTKEQEIGLLPRGFDKSKKNVAFFNSSMDEYEGIPDFNNPLYEDDNKGIEAICGAFLENHGYHFYLRVHPNLKGLDTSQLKTIKNLGARFNNLTIIAADEHIDSYALMQAVDLIVTFGSTMGVEAVFWNKPSMLLGRAFYEDLNGVIRPQKHEEAVYLINNIPAAATSNYDVIKFGYWCLKFGVDYTKFKPDGLFTGTFLGKLIKPSIISRIKSKISIVFFKD